MGSGEDSVHHLSVTLMGDEVPPESVTLPNVNSSVSNLTNITTSSTYPYTAYYPSSWYYSYPATIYKYQVKCPKRSCKTFNWLELEKITPCTKCGAKLLATADIPDFTIPVTG